MTTQRKFSTILIGTESLLILCGEALREGGHTILGVVSRARSVVDWARGHGIRVIDPDADLVAELEPIPFDYLFSITNLDVVPDAVLALPSQGAINFHDGPLPRYAGVFTTSWAVINRESTHGISWHWMSSGIDRGHILKHRAVPISSTETAFTLNNRCFEAGIESFRELIEELASGRIQTLVQDSKGRSYYGRYKRPEAAGLISWEQPALAIEALVRGLDFGPYLNPLGLAKLWVNNEVVAVKEVRAKNDHSEAAPGTLLAIGREALEVATGLGGLEVRRLCELDGTELSPVEFCDHYRLRVGDRLSQLPLERASQVTALNERLARHESFWLERLSEMQGPEIPYAEVAAGEPQNLASVAIGLPQQVLAWLASNRAQESPADALTSAFCIYLARIRDNYTFDLAFCDQRLAGLLNGPTEALFASHVPLHLGLDPHASLGQARQSIAAELAVVRQHHSYARDMLARYPELRAIAPLPIAIEHRGSLSDYRLPRGSQLALVLDTDGTECRWFYRPEVFAPQVIETMQRQFIECLEAMVSSPDTPLAKVSLLSPSERQRLLVQWNRTVHEIPSGVCVHQAFEQQAAETPAALALVWGDEQITYRELNRRANQLAHRLRRLHVGPEVLVGVCIERSLELLVATLGILKAGGAYLPLDTAYPVSRLEYLLRDARPALLLTTQSLLDRLPDTGIPTLCLDSQAMSQETIENVASSAAPHHLAYVLYTSGSTGFPKGVMVEHRNVMSFFAAMDQRIPHDPPGVWLAVTSLSFDISVLELFWTLARGFKVVLYTDPAREAARAARSSARRPLEFSLFYFASDEQEAVADKYRLLLEGARFADEHGFCAVWTPERHFHAFGGLYPNPSVASAAIAAITKQVAIRAGSCVLPLHHPIRVAEEWALVDNLSQGRVGISFASGWQPNDFVLAPEKFAERKEAMFRDLETVRRLWRGETVSLLSPLGKEVEIRTLPRPVQAELPVWITAAGNPETFELAARIGAGILTHLLGQSFAEVAEKCALYRRVWRESGHPGRGHVSLMLHTFVGPDESEVREWVRAPMKGYLRSAVNLIKEAAWTFPTFKQKATAQGRTPSEVLDAHEFSEQEMDELLDYAFERYYKSSGFFGTPESCLEIIAQLRQIDVDEIACLIDFGVPSVRVLEHLPYLDEVRRRAEADTVAAQTHSLAALAERHEISHLQCTPAMLGMFLADEDSHRMFALLRQILVGGEAFPPSLATELARVSSAEVLNLYGPTETSIWSSAKKITPGEPITIGRPVANTEFYILDSRGEPVPPGVPGELFIGGAGVARGYLNRPELTAERFVENPFSAEPGARLYRTGDRVRYRADGEVEFLGRLDHQVKIRGFRVELGEIEAAILEQPEVGAAVVTLRSNGSQGEQLVAHLTARPGATIKPDGLRQRLHERLPDFMIPSHFLVLPALPLTPNGKLDRKALPSPEQVLPQAEKDDVLPPQTPAEQLVAKVWKAVLNIGSVSIYDNFFELGGHSLLAMRVIARLEKATGRRLSPVMLAMQNLAQIAAELPVPREQGSAGAPPKDLSSQAAPKSLSKRLFEALGRGSKKRLFR